MNDFLNFTRGLIGQGAALGWGDEAEAFLRSKVQGVPYDKALANVRQEYGQYAQAHPILAPATEFVGGALPAVASYLAAAGSGGLAAPAAAATTARNVGALARIASSPYVRTALASMAAGAVGGAGSATDDRRLEGADIGGKIGLLTGAIMPPVIHGGGKAFKWLGDRLIPTEEKINKTAAEKINRALSEARGGAGMTPAEAQQIVTNDINRNIPSTFANVDPATVSLAETAAQRSGIGASRIGKVIGDQARGSRQRVYERTRQALGGRDYYEDDQKLVQDLRDSAKGLYEKAYEFGTVNDPVINSILDTPKFKYFFDKASDIADTEALAAKLRGENPEKYMLKNIYEPTGRTHENGRPIYKLKTLPDVRTLDNVKRAIDATIEKGFEGKGMSSAEAIGTRKLRKEFVNAIDQATIDETGESAYKQARKKFAGDMEVIDALRAGRNDFGKLSNQEISRLINNMGDSEKEAFRTGVNQYIYDSVMNTPQNINAAKRIIGSPETVKKLQPLFDSPSQFNLFSSALQREAQFIEHAQQMLGGSATARRLRAREQFDDDSGAADIAIGALNKGFFHSLINVAMRAARNSSMTDKMADKAAQMLMSNTPQEVAATVAFLEKYGASAQQAAQKMAAAKTGAALGTTRVLLPTPVYELSEAEKASIPNAETDLGNVSGEGKVLDGNYYPTIRPTEQDTAGTSVIGRIPDIEKDLTNQEPE